MIYLNRFFGYFQSSEQDFIKNIKFKFAIVSLVLIWLSFYLSIPTYPLFVVFFIFTLLFNFPIYALSPLVIFYAYYGVWYVVAPIFGKSYQGYLFYEHYSLAICYVYSTFVLGVVSIEYGKSLGRSVGSLSICKVIKKDTLSRILILLYILTIALLVCIITFSGGLRHWINDPGEAFLNRGGTGVYVVLSHFGSWVLALLSGYYSYVYSRKWPMFLFFLWLSVTSPVHGSKFFISTLLIISLIPWIKNLSFLSYKTGLLYCSLISVFFIGLMFRNYPLSLFLNYFSAYSNFATLFFDFEPSYFKTFFLPFVKFQTPFGLSEPHMYYDMNHMLTAIYRPDAWEIRATEQWPVEVDLFLNFKYSFGTPLVAFYLVTISFLHQRALGSNSLGYWFASVLMMLYMLSHLRGSLINHTDFYMYPFIIIAFYSLRNIRLMDKDENIGSDSK